MGEGLLVLYDISSLKKWRRCFCFLILTPIDLWWSPGSRVCRNAATTVSKATHVSTLSGHKGCLAGSDWIAACLISHNNEQRKWLFCILQFSLWTQRLPIGPKISSLLWQTSTWNGRRKVPLGVDESKLHCHSSRRWGGKLKGLLMIN